MDAESTSGYPKAEEPEAEEEHMVVEKEESDDDGAQDLEHDDSFVSLERRPSQETTHRSGVPFPPELLLRFQEDLSKQDHFKRDYPKAPGKHCYGAARPQMSLNLRSMEEDRELIQIAARFYNTLKKKGHCWYMHHHHPDWFGHEKQYGVDCSNFTSHLLNLCFGVRLSSAVVVQYEMDLPKVTSWSDLRPGDFAYFPGKVKHVGICVEGPGKPSIIHSTSAITNGKNGPTLASNRKGWPIANFSHGFRFEDLRKTAFRNTIRKYTQAQLQAEVVNAGVSQEKLDKAVEEAVKHAMVHLLVETVIVQDPSKVPSVSPGEDGVVPLVDIDVERSAVEERTKALTDTKAKNC